jgi:hypothetical protein
MRDRGRSARWWGTGWRWKAELGPEDRRGVNRAAEERGGVHIHSVDGHLWLLGLEGLHRICTEQN